MMQRASQGAIMATRPSPPSGKLAGRRMVDAMRVEESIGIDRPVQEVFEYVSEADNFPEWTGTAIEVRKRAPGPFGKATPSRPLSSSLAAGRDALRTDLLRTQPALHGAGHGRSPPRPALDLHLRRKPGDAAHAGRGGRAGRLLQAGRSAHRAGARAPGESRPGDAEGSAGGAALTGLRGGSGPASGWPRVLRSSRDYCCSWCVARRAPGGSAFLASASASVAFLRALRRRMRLMRPAFGSSALARWVSVIMSFTHAL